MIEAVLASRNAKKIEELRRILEKTLPGIKLFSLSDIGYDDEIEETGGTYEENAIIKASVPASLGYIGIADDSGLSVDVLGGAPGVTSARFAGEGCTPADCRVKLLEEMKGVPDENRGAGFVSVMALCLPDGSAITVPEKYAISEKLAALTNRKRELTLTVRGECRGVITTREIGTGGFGYDSLFLSDDLGVTFGEATAEAKDGVSHRGRSLEAFSRVLGEIFGGNKC